MKENMKEVYKVKNYHNFINLPTEDDRKPIVLEAGDFNGLNPFVKKLTLSQIQYINLRCEVFKTGRLEFEECDEAELFEYLDIYQPEKIFRAEEIVDIIKHPTKEKLERVVSIDNLNTIDLFRALVVSFGNLGNEDISGRVSKVINQRRNEIYRNPSEQTKISIKKTSDEIQSEAREIANENAMKIAIAKMEEKLTKKYEKQIKDLMSKNDKKTKEDSIK